MTKDEFLREETERLEETLTALARARGLIGPDDKVKTSLSFMGSDLVKHMSVEEFFADKRFDAAGIPTRYYKTIIHNFDWIDLHEMTIKTFLDRYSVEDLLRFKNVGFKTVGIMTKLIRAAGLTIRDPLKKFL